MLSEKNGRVGSGSSLAAAAAAAAVPQPVTPSASTSSITAREHPAHLMSTEQKHALTVADERSENEVRFGFHQMGKYSGCATFFDYSVDGCWNIKYL